MTPLVSVIIPTYNYGRFLPYAVNSVTAQTLEDFELIIVDDGSTDNTSSIVARMNDPRISYYRQANQGPAVARNTGLAAAKGNYIAFLDADDRWLPEKLQLQVQALEAQPAAAMVYCHYKYVNAQGSLVNTIKRSIRGALFEELLHSNIIGSPSVVMIRTENLRAIGGFSAHLRGTEDWHVWLRIAINWKIDVVSTILAELTDHAESLSKNLYWMARDSCIMQAILQSELDDLVPKRLWDRAWCYRLMGYGHIYAEAGNFHTAYTIFWRAIRHDPTYIQAWLLFIASLGRKPVYATLWHAKSIQNKLRFI